MGEARVPIGMSDSTWSWEADKDEPERRETLFAPPELLRRGALVGASLWLAEVEALVLPRDERRADFGSDSKLSPLRFVELIVTGSVQRLKNQRR